MQDIAQFFRHASGRIISKRQSTTTSRVSWHLTLHKGFLPYGCSKNFAESLLEMRRATGPGSPSPIWHCDVSYLTQFDPKQFATTKTCSSVKVSRYLKIKGGEGAILNNDLAVDDREVHKAQGRGAEDQGGHGIWAAPAEPNSVGPPGHHVSSKARRNLPDVVPAQVACPAFDCNVEGLAGRQCCTNKSSHHGAGICSVNAPVQETI